jgi:hypothetical protein
MQLAITKLRDDKLAFSALRSLERPTLVLELILTVKKKISSETNP